jgi:hypothetical protein
VHGKDVAISIDGDDLSAFTNSVETKRSADSHDVTCFGQTGHVYAAGLTDGTVSLKGTYDNTASGPDAILEPLVGAEPVVVLYKAEGTGSGKPLWTYNAQLTAYEQSAPVADMVTWTAELQISGAVTPTTQG